MSTHADLERRLAMIELLSRPDPFDALRIHRRVLEGRADRHTQLPRLASAYVQGRLLEMRERESGRETAV